MEQLQAINDGIIKSGTLYDILHQGQHHFIGFYSCEQNGCDGRICFFCFNTECQGDRLYFPADEILIMERTDTNPAVIARAVYNECDKIKSLIDSMGWGYNAEIFIERVCNK